jgi:hypothetical protein
MATRKKIDSSKVHNAHLLIPQDLWQRLKKRAKLGGSSITDVVCDALRAYLFKPVLTKSSAPKSDSK